MTTNVPRAISRFVEAQEWLDLTGDIVKLAVQRAYQLGGPVGQVIKNFLHGVWLGHPLHPVLTDVPLGALTVTAVLDGLEGVTDDRRYGYGADAALTLGVAGAVGAAAAGLTDYQHMEKGAPRRLGLVHGVMNLASTALYIASMVARRSGQRAAGRQLGLTAYAMMLGSAYLGGQMVYDHRVGVKRVPEAEEPERFTPVLAVESLREGQLKKVDAAGLPVLLVRRGDRVFAMAETCTHLGGPLSEGTLEGDTVICPWHQSRYQLSDGAAVDGPSTYAQACFETRIRNGQIEVRKAREAEPEPAVVKPSPARKTVTARKTPAQA